MRSVVENTESYCRICNTLIVKETYSTYTGDPLRRMIGPGGAAQMTKVRKLYCPECGISYHKLPENPKTTK